MKSTVPPGTGEQVRAWLDARGLSHVGYVSNPEFLAEGTAVANFMRPDRVVVGSFRSEEGDRVALLHEELAAPIVRADVTSAEMIKYASNAFLATKISFINEIANVCEEVGADVTVVADGMGLDRRIGPHFLKAGIGYGGSCFPKDVSALKQLAGNSGYHFQLLTSVIEVNELQKRRVVGKLQRHLEAFAVGRSCSWTRVQAGHERHSRSFEPRPGTPPARRRGTRQGVGSGRDRGRTAAPPRGSLLRRPPRGRYRRRRRSHRHGVGRTERIPRPEVRTAMRSPLIVDGRNLLDPDAVRGAGFAYEGIGRPLADRRAPVRSTRARRSTRSLHRPSARALDERMPDVRRAPSRRQPAVPSRKRADGDPTETSESGLIATVRNAGCPRRCSLK